jgi:cell division protein FtsQ
VSTKDPNSPDQRPDEISVTEVSDEVLAELSHLFSSGSGGNHTIDDDITVDIVIVDSTVVQVVADFSGEVVEVPEIIEVDNVAVTSNVISIVDESVPPAVQTPIDPLIIGMADNGEFADDENMLVVIDDESHDRVVIVDDDRPDPRFEERQRRHKRRERLQKVKWLKIGGGIVAVVVVTMAILASPLFAIRSVTIEGVVYTSDETITSVRKTLKGASVFTVDTGRAREILLADPWVSDVRVTTRFPGKALVEVSEREPVVWYVASDQKARIVDARGHVIAVLDGWPTKYLQVKGVGPVLEGGAVADDAYRAAAQLVLALPDEIRPKVTSLELTGGGELSMNLKGGTIVRFGPPTDLQNKLVAVVVLLRRQDPATLAVVDVSTGEPAVQIR